MREPIALRRVEASYPIDAIQARARGEVVLEVVVLPDGSVGPVRVVKAPLPAFGLDDAAINAAKQWLFRPGTLGGKPVPMLVTVIQEFTHGQPPPPQWPYWVPDAEFLKGVALIGQRGVTMPVLERSVEPKYTADAMRAKLMGTVTVDMVIGPDGTVLRSRIARSLDPTFGLDRTAIEAASQWRFTAGLVNGNRHLSW